MRYPVGVIVIVSIVRYNGVKGAVMEKLYFKNFYINIVIGALLIIFVVVGRFFTSVIEDFLPYMFASVLALITLKRFIYQFKKTSGKNVTLILGFEFFIDMIAIGLLVFLQSHISIFIGLVIYMRGVSYLLINYLSKRKIDLLSYLFNIGFVTLGAFFIFSTILNDERLLWVFTVILFVFGFLYALVGVFQWNQQKTKKKVQLKN